jgi:DNA repair ATPase RecN
MKQWQPFDIYLENLKSFKSQYESVPGVISISDDNWDGSSFIVMTDNTKFNVNSIPQTYKGLDIFVVDVYGEVKTYQGIIDDAKEKYPELKENDSALAIFNSRMNMLNEIIKNYESGLKESVT